MRLFGPIPLRKSAYALLLVPLLALAPIAPVSAEPTPEQASKQTETTPPPAEAKPAEAAETETNPSAAEPNTAPEADTSAGAAEPKAVPEADKSATAPKPGSPKAHGR